MMKPIYEFKTIQVELTNACVHSCSNCTRFCGHHKKPFYMNWETFKNAVDSLENWPRLIGIMGGEPTLHPQFERFVNYAHDKHPMQYNIGGGAHPLKSLSKYVIDANEVKTGPLNKFRGLGLWSTVSDKYYKHYELIQDKFVFQCINDHTASSRHQPWLMTRSEFGIPDEEWIPMRNNCWWHRTLNSPSITPKGAFFCEVAAAMDMLFDGPGGWKVEKDWWKRDFDDYSDQLHWCELCCGAFITFDRDANEETDDVSPVMYQKLLEVDSPKAKKSGGVIVHEITQGGELKTKPRKNMLLYQDNDELRFTNLNRCLYPNRIHGVVWGDRQAENSTFTAKVETLFDGVTVINAQDENAFITLAKIIRDEKDWIAVVPSGADFEADFRSKINEMIFNPGTLHHFANNSVMMFSVNADSLKSKGFSAIANLENIDDLCTIWSEDKISILGEDYHEVEGVDLENWIEKLTHMGIIEFNYIRPHINNMILRRRIEPAINKIMSTKTEVEDKIAALDDIYHGDVGSGLLINKIKTTIHNALATQLKTTSPDKVINLLLTRQDSFCANYALAMLSVGDKKEGFLINCIKNAQNKYLLGFDTLKRHYDFFAVAKNHSAPQQNGIIAEIVELDPTSNGICLLGNMYRGKSIEMILSRADKSPKVFVDNQKVGSYFEGLPTITLGEYIEQYPPMSMLMTEHNNEFEEQTILELERRNHTAHIIKLHPLTYAEMNMSSDVAQMGVLPDTINKIKNLMDDQNNVKCKEIFESL